MNISHLTWKAGWPKTRQRFVDWWQQHLDALLEIKSLAAIEWTPQAGIEQGGHPRWYPLYRRILAAGKSVQAVCVKAQEVLPLLEATGPDGMYILAEFENEAEAENIIQEVKRRFSA